MALSIDTIDPDELDPVADLLAAHDLPHQDIQDSPAVFYQARRAGQRVAIGGLETCPPDALLRSLLVLDEQQGQGIGSAVCKSLENRARRQGIETVYLLTTTASGFFADRGYERIDRQDAPEPIQATTEFSQLCPDSAVCMAKELAVAEPQPAPAREIEDTGGDA